MTLVRWILLGLALVWGAALVIAPGATVIVSLLYLYPIAMTLTAIWLIVWVPTLLRDGNPALLAVERFAAGALAATAFTLAGFLAGQALAARLFVDATRLGAIDRDLVFGIWISYAVFWLPLLIVRVIHLWLRDRRRKGVA